MLELNYKKGNEKDKRKKTYNNENMSYNYNSDTLMRYSKEDKRWKTIIVREKYKHMILKNTKNTGVREQSMRSNLGRMYTSLFELK